MSFFKYLPKARPAPGTSTGTGIEKVPSNSFVSTLAPRVDSAPKKVEKKNDKIDDPSDILYIDTQIREKLTNKIKELGTLEEDLVRMEWIKENGIDIADKAIAKTEAVKIRRKIQDIEFGAELALYIYRSSHLIEEYLSLIESIKKNSFVVTGVKDENKNMRISQLILEYLRIAKEYIDIKHFKQKPQKIVCEGCKGIDLFSSDGDSSILTCRECGNVVELLDDAPSFKDSERVNMASRYTYTCRGHFIEAMNRFEGKQNIDIKPEIIDTLKQQLSLHNLTQKTATKDHIYMFLSENKFSDYYADINLIYFMITGVNPPDITDYRNELLEMHDQIEEAYQEVKDEERLNSLNVNWKLYKTLQLVDYPCKKDDFFCLKTPAKQGEHEQKWYDMIEYLKSKYPNAVTSNGKKRWRHMKTL